MGKAQIGDSILYTIVVFIVPLILSISYAVICSNIAKYKGRSSVGWGFLGFFFGLIAIIIIAIASNLEKEREMYELLLSLQHEEKEPKKSILLARSSNSSHILRIERIGYFKPEVRVLFTLSNIYDEPLYEKDLLLETIHDLEESDITDIRWLENKIEVDILHNRKKPPRTYTFEY